MSIKSILIGSLILGIAIIVGSFYFVFRTKTEDLSNKFPYNEIINKTLKTQQECFITLHKHSLEHPYILDITDTNFYETANPIYKLPRGTSLKIEKTKAFTTPVSGATHSIVLGSVYVSELKETVKFELFWGENPTYGLYDYDDNYDIYPLAPWQEEALPFKYFWDGRIEPHDWEAWNSL
ncbi:hypothetical protein JQC67_01190 [Aurantibacter crassamenti]|uniref:hypothetical protein n=1 Tax=Aurantibacter crassamenti TaxID=1837375 RepID=UPI001939F59B|nr:hypothetical protein [Aurantibacter crassamenti]MBM1104739.1 hypothetical protein [Aurantibacter crassamenti]